MSGTASWWFNYGHGLTRVFKGKASLAVALLILEITAIVLWATNREALIDRECIVWICFALVLVMIGLVVSLGKPGGGLVFPAGRSN